MNVGFLGTGRMGLPMCANLVRAGHTVAAFDVRPECRPAVEDAGARWDPDPWAGAEAVITMLPGPREVERVARSGSATWIDMSTSAPAMSVTPDVDAPVSGGVEAAHAGTLRIHAGGDPAVVARCRPVLDALGDVHHVGGQGAGITTKLLVNLLWFAQVVATGEALLLARRSGLDLRVLRDALAASPSAAGEVDRLLAGDYRASFGLDRCVEELATVTAHARAIGVALALGEHVEQVHRRALERFGPVDGELLAVALLEQEAGTDLRACGR